jgi:hypothetical protein
MSELEIITDSSIEPGDLDCPPSRIELEDGRTLLITGWHPHVVAGALVTVTLECEISRNSYEPPGVY